MPKGKVVRRYKAGYEIRAEKILPNFGSRPPFTIQTAYTPEGLYIGSTRMAYMLCAKHGIIPELAGSNHRVCSIGFSPRDQKWYGWSHRAIHGFAVGDVVAAGDCVTHSGYIPSYIARHPEKDLSLPVGFTARNLDDCKRMAVAFAESVG